MQKYLILRPHRWRSDGYEVKECASVGEVATDLQEHGAKDAVVARRMDVRLQLCDWEAPEPEEEAF